MEASGSLIHTAVHEYGAHLLASSSSRISTIGVSSDAYELPIPKFHGISKESDSHSIAVYNVPKLTQSAKEVVHSMQGPSQISKHFPSATSIRYDSPATNVLNKISTPIRIVVAATGSSSANIGNHSPPVFNYWVETMAQSSVCIIYTSTTTVIVEGTGLP